MRNTGITLIALVITVIIMVILAAVGISLITGQDGLFSQANNAGQAYTNASREEKTQMDALQQMLDLYNEGLPDNAPDTTAGTKVKLPQEWFTANPALVSDVNGEVLKLASLSDQNVSAISDGIGNVIPVPTEFYYVGGTLESGVVISDNIKDKNKYAGEELVPSGASWTDAGILRTEADYDGLTAEQKREFIVGNQFVWIPCEPENYVKTNWGQGNKTNICQGYWDTTIDTAGKLQVKKYSGFYVGRFEAGMPNDVENLFPTTGIKYKSAAPYPQTLNVSREPLVKAGVAPWVFIDWTKSLENAEKMYNNDAKYNKYVNSGLITGAQWDVMINKIASLKDENGVQLYSLSNPNTWANYYNVEIPYTGRYAKFTYSTLTLPPFTSTSETNLKTASSNYLVFTTGASDKTRVYNIYDVSGGLWEWTLETSFAGTASATQYRVVRGGSYYNTSVDSPTLYRNSDIEISRTYFNVGFRVVLYMR